MTVQLTRKDRLEAFAKTFTGSNAKLVKQALQIEQKREVASERLTIARKTLQTLETDAGILFDKVIKIADYLMITNYIKLHNITPDKLFQLVPKQRGKVIVVQILEVVKDPHYDNLTLRCGVYSERTGTLSSVDSYNVVNWNLIPYTPKFNEKPVKLVQTAQKQK